jgi:hypothetical protein
MPRFGGFGVNTGSLVGGLVNNVVGSAASAIFPRGVFGGFGIGDGVNLLGTLNNQDPTNRRVSLRPRPAAANRVLGKGLLDPLRETNNGMVWPYTPTINYQQDIDYQTISTVHTNQDFHIFARTPATSFSVDGQFTVQNQKEGRYALACIHFLRTMSKMHFGENDKDAGTPPPILLFNAYGPFVFNNLPVIVKSYSIGFPDDVDYVQVASGLSPVNQPTVPNNPAGGSIIAENLPPIPGVPAPSIRNNPNDLIYNDPGAPSGRARTIDPRADMSWADPLNNPPGASVQQPTPSTTKAIWLPSLFKISVTLIVQHTPTTLRKRFELPKYINGDPSQSDFI